MPPRSSHITPAGAAKLRAELEQLWHVERPQVTAAVADAAAMGDRSENAEYIYGKRRLREIDRRVRYLTKRLENAHIVSDKPRDLARVFFGAHVELEDEDGNTTNLQIVGADEFDPKAGLISVDSPFAKAILGKRLDDEVEIVRPKGKTLFTITNVRYD